MNRNVSRALIDERDTLRPKMGFNIRENFFYATYEPKLKKEYSIEHIIQQSAFRWQHRDKRGRGLTCEYNGISSHDRHAASITATVVVHR